MKKILTYCLKTLKWIVIGVLALVALVLVLLYLPPVQDFAVSRALTSVNASGDMHIAVKRLRLSFPIRLSVDSLSMHTSGMEIKAGSLRTSVEVLPLITGTASIPGLSINGAVVNIGTPDSTLYMRARIDRATLGATRVGLSSSTVSASSLKASGGNIDMVLTPDTVAQPATESAPVTWKISLAKAELDSIRYHMQLDPTITDLDCTLPKATLTDGVIDLGKSTIDVKEISISDVDARYITPTAEYLASHPAPEVADTDTVAPQPWTIRANRLMVLNSHAIYATDGAVPTANFDPSYIEASEINIEVDSFINRGMEITVPIKRISAREHCGIAIDLTGTFAMDSTAMYARQMMLTTPSTTISLDAMMGMQPVNPPVKVNLGAQIGIDDVRRLVPATLEPMIAKLPPYQPLNVNADIEGRMENLQVHRLSAGIPRHIAISAEGSIADYSDLNKAHGDIDITGTLSDGAFLKAALFDAKTGRAVNIPPLRLEGSAGIARGVIDGRLRALTSGGDIALDAMWNNRVEGYDIQARFNDFPVQAILPTAGVKDLDATITAKGEGLDFFSPKTATNASVILNHVVYNGQTYRDVTLDAMLSGGNAKVEAKSTNPAANFAINADGNLTGQPLDWTFDGAVRHIDLHALGLTDSVAQGSVTLSGKASFVPAVAATRRAPGKPMSLSADIDIAALDFSMGAQNIRANGLGMTFNTADSITDATISNNDLRIGFTTPVALDTLMASITLAQQRLDRDMQRRRLAIDSLQQALPPFTFSLASGTGANLLTDYLSQQNITFSNLNVKASNDTIIQARALLTQLKSGNTRVDTLTLDLHQRGAYMLYEAGMNNRPGTFDQFANVVARGYISDNHLSLLFRQENIEGDTGYSLGLMAQMADSTTVNVRFVPFHPIIGYKDWEINKDNIIKFNLATKHLDANIDLKNSESSLRLYTEHNNQNDSVQEDIILKISDIKLADWIALNPFAPPITGDLSADMRVNWNLPDINGNGTVSLTDFYYARQKVGDFDLGLDVSTNAAGTVRAATSLKVNGQEAITAVGNLNDSTATNPFMLDFKMIHFPLSIVNPFLPPGTASISGMLNGEMDVTGKMSEPQFNGYLDFDSTTVNVAVLGTPFHFSEEKIPVENNVVKFNNFTISGANENPLIIDGNVNMQSLTSPTIGLTLTARNMQIVNSQKNRKSQAYGKAYINLDANVKGSLSMLNVNAALNLLPGTNVSYVIPDAVSAIQSRSAQDMVKFVNFNDTTAVADADSIAPTGMLMNIDARLTISTGTTVNVDLSADGKDKVQIISNGTLSYTQDFMNDQRFTGRLNLTGGFVRYSIPVMGEKMFNFQDGSYISFNGDMMNPILHVIATDKMKANVSVNSNNRVVNFDVGLSVTGTLDEMNVAFDLDCPDDITIANELKSMTPEQRANQAMNLLISGTYRSGGTQTISSGNAGTNALFSFLESQLNSWASSAIKGVDISFGINQYDKTVDGANTTSMNYSYQVSKSLFNDRFKIVVGGNYSTDAEADENFAQNLIADISFEYLLNKAGTKYIRLFRHTGYESILEGEITQTGVGFVYKKKIQRIGDIFRFLKPKKRKTVPAPSGSDTPIPARDNNTEAVISNPATTKNSSDDE